MKKLEQDEHGVAKIVLVVMAVLVLAGVGFAAWRVSESKNKGESNNSASTASTIAANKEAESACKKLYNDGDLCKFASYANLTTASYKASFTSKDSEGKISTFEISQDSKGNTSTIILTDGKETGAMMSLDGDSYIKDPTDNVWTKYPKSPSNTDDSKNPTESLDIDFEKEAGLAADKRVSYKKLGKEKCGNGNCFKYQIFDPEQKDITESIVWFSDKDFQLRKWSSTSTDGATNVGEFNYTSVTISAPSPVKEAPAVPSAAEIQKQIQDAQNAAQ